MNLFRRFSPKILSHGIFTCTVESTETQSENLIFPHDFLEKFRQSNFFTKELYYKLISRKNFEVGVNSRHYHTAVGYLLLQLFGKTFVVSTFLL